MTEKEWLSAVEAMPLVLWLRDNSTKRRLRLFACACCRTISPITRSEEFEFGYTSAVATLEEYCDDSVSDDEFWTVQNNARFLAISDTESNKDAGRYVLIAAAEADHFDPAWVVQYATEALLATKSGPPFVLTGLVRDIFGNPFRKIRRNKKWLTSTVVALARQMYESRDFSTMPILVDALMDAGCNNAEILDHCRNGGPHVRGCFVVDLVLGKS